MTHTAYEIERKFLVRDTFKNFVVESFPITQGYLSSVPERSVRIRIKKDKAFITVKGIGNETGITRYEWQKEIALPEANDLLELCEKGIIEKTRHIIPAGLDLFFEVDEFHGENEGLILAEIELPRENTPFPKPVWLGKEVTGDSQYYNAMLSRNPYSSWKKK